jgi:hypothetical protein
VHRHRPVLAPTGDDDGGYATAEAALALPALLVVLALAVGVVVSVGAQLRAVDAARAAARVVARGDSDAAATRAASALTPGGAQVRISHHGRDVEVRVDADLHLTRWLPTIHVSARAVAEAEGPTGSARSETVRTRP